jgi:hypothetical protein
MGASQNTCTALLLFRWVSSRRKEGVLQFSWEPSPKGTSFPAHAKAEQLESSRAVSVARHVRPSASVLARWP